MLSSSVRPRINFSVVLPSSALEFIFTYGRDKNFVWSCQLVCKEWFNTLLTVYLNHSDNVILYLNELQMFSKDRLVPSIQVGLSNPTNDKLRHDYVLYTRQYFRMINDPKMSYLLDYGTFTDMIYLLKSFVVCLRKSDSTLHIDSVSSIIHEQRIKFAIYMSISLYKVLCIVCDSIRVANFYMDITLSDLHIDDDSSVIRKHPPRRVITPLAKQIINNVQERIFTPIVRQTLEKLNKVELQISHPLPIRQAIIITNGYTHLWRHLPHFIINMHEEEIDDLEHNVNTDSDDLGDSYE